MLFKLCRETLSRTFSEHTYGVSQYPVRAIRSNWMFQIHERWLAREGAHYHPGDAFNQLTCMPGGHWQSIRMRDRNATLDIQRVRSYK